MEANQELSFMAQKPIDWGVLSPLDQVSAPPLLMSVYVEVENL